MPRFAVANIKQPICRTVLGFAAHAAGGIYEFCFYFTTVPAYLLEFL